MINWGVIGLGSMANKFASAILEITNAKLLGVSSSKSERLNNFSKKYNIDIKYRFNKYEALLKCNDIDAVYISTLNNSHLDLIIKCAENNKHVLCEKPMTMHYKESKEAASHIKKSNIFFMEAIAYRSHPQTDNIIKLINNNEIGKINSIKSSFGFLVKRIKPESRLFNKSLGGGAILDLGCYPLSFLSLFRNNRKEMLIESAKGTFCHTGVEDYAEANLIINERIKANIKVSFKDNCENNSIIYGDNGHIIVSSPWLPENKSCLEIYKKDQHYKFFSSTDKSVYAQQISNVSNLIENNAVEGKFPNINLKESTEIMKLISEWKEKIKL